MEVQELSSWRAVPFPSTFQSSSPLFHRSRMHTLHRHKHQVRIKNTTHTGSQNTWASLILGSDCHRQEKQDFSLVSRNQVTGEQGHCLGYSSDLASSSWLNSATASGKSCINHGRGPTVYLFLYTGWPLACLPRTALFVLTSSAHSHVHISHTEPDASLCHAPTTWVTSSCPGQEAVRASTYTTHA